MDFFTPRSLIAGSLPASRGQAGEQALDAAALLLGQEALGVIHSRAEGRIWYLAAPAADLASHLDARCPLSVALPGMSSHQGEGAYTTDLPGGLQAVVIRQGVRLSSFVGLPAQVERFIAQEGASAVHASLAPGSAWQFPLGQGQRQALRLQMAMTVSGLAVAVIAAGSWLWAAQASRNQLVLQQQLQQKHQEVWHKTLKSLEPPPYPAALAHLQQAVAQAIDQRGTLLQFEHRDGRSTWRLKVGREVLQRSAP